VRIFNDVLIAGAAEVALNKVLSAAMLSEPTRGEEAWQLTHAIATPVNFTYPKRIWWRTTNKDGIRPAYISLNPGEYRTVEPTGPDDVIWDPNSSSPAEPLADILQSVLEDSKSEAISQTATLRRYQSYAINALAEIKTPSHGFAAERFQSAARELRKSGASHQQHLVNDLYDTCLYQFRFPLTDFSLCMLLLQLQGMCSQWIEQNAYAEPPGFYFGYVEMMAKGIHRSRLIESLKIAGNVNYADAKRSIKNGLDAYSLDEHTKYLTLGAHQYFTALCVARANERCRLGLNLDYTLLVAEEGFACTSAGIMSGFQFFLADPDSLVINIVQQLASKDSLGAITRGLCTAVYPTLTKFFARTLVARALTMKMGPQFSDGLKQLHGLEQEHASNCTLGAGAFEASWLNHCLLNAYRALGDQEMVQKYALKIAATLIVGKTLGV